MADWELKKPTHLYCLGFTFFRGMKSEILSYNVCRGFDYWLIDYNKPWNGHPRNQPAWDEVFGPQNLKIDQTGASHLTRASLMIGDLIYPKRSMVTLLPFNHTAKGSCYSTDGWMSWSREVSSTSNWIQENMMTFLQSCKRDINSSKDD